MTRCFYRFSPRGETHTLLPKTNNRPIGSSVRTNDLKGLPETVRLVMMLDWQARGDSFLRETAFFVNFAGTLTSHFESYLDRQALEVAGSYSERFSSRLVTNSSEGSQGLPSPDLEAPCIYCRTQQLSQFVAPSFAIGRRLELRRTMVSSTCHLFHLFLSMQSMLFYLFPRF